MLERFRQMTARWPDEQRRQQAITLIRMAAGMFLLAHGYEKWIDPQFAGKLSGILETWAVANPYGFYKQFLLQVAIPHAGLFAALVTLGELGAGCSLISGFLVSFSAPVLFFMSLNFFLAAQHTGPAVQGLNLAFMTMALALYWARAGMCHGLDAWIFRSETPKGKPEVARKPKKAARVTASQLIERKSRKKPRPKSKPF